MSVNCENNHFQLFDRSCELEVCISRIISGEISPESISDSKNATSISILLDTDNCCSGEKVNCEHYDELCNLMRYLPASICEFKLKTEGRVKLHKDFFSLLPSNLTSLSLQHPEFDEETGKNMFDLVPQNLTSLDLKFYYTFTENPIFISLPQKLTSLCLSGNMIRETYATIPSTLKHLKIRGENFEINKLGEKYPLLETFDYEMSVLDDLFADDYVMSQKILKSSEIDFPRNLEYFRLKQIDIILDSPLPESLTHVGCLLSTGPDEEMSMLPRGLKVLEFEGYSKTLRCVQYMPRNIKCLEITDHDSLIIMPGSVLDLPQSLESMKVWLRYVSSCTIENLPRRLKELILYPDNFSRDMLCLLPPSIESFKVVCVERGNGIEITNLRDDGSIGNLIEKTYKHGITDSVVNLGSISDYLK